MNLTQKVCKACEGGVQPLTVDEIKPYLAEISPEWRLSDDSKYIRREFKLDSFRAGIEFVKKVADLAESEGHHPDIDIRYSKVTLDLTTHAIDGLSENDFIVAAKVDKI